LTSGTRGASLAPGSPVATNDSASWRVSLPGSVATTSRRIMSERTGRMRVQAEMAARGRRAVRGFAAVETWVVDLDNTLYPHHVNLWQQVDVRIRDYIANFLKLTHDEAFRLQKDLYRRYGTSLRGLMEERARSRRISGDGPRHRLFAAHAQSGARGGD